MPKINTMNFPLSVLLNTRKSFKKIIENYTLEELNTIPKGFNNNIIWHIGHILVTEQLLGYGLSGLPKNVREELIEKYRKGTKPETKVSQEEVDEIKILLISTIEKTIRDYKSELFKDYQEYTVSTTGNTLRNIDDALQFIMFHEGIHLGYILSLLRVVRS